MPFDFILVLFLPVCFVQWIILEFRAGLAFGFGIFEGGKRRDTYVLRQQGWVGILELGTFGVGGNRDMHDLFLDGWMDDMDGRLLKSNTILTFFFISMSFVG
jgi:hypothetical protein